MAVVYRNPKELELQLAKEILAEVFRVRLSEVDEMIQNRFESPLARGYSQRRDYGHRNSRWMPVGTEFLSDGNTHQIHVLVIFLEDVYTVHRHISRSGLHHDQAFSATTPAARGFARSFPA